MLQRMGSIVLFLLGCSLLAAQEDEKLLSGPRPGTFMPAPFECYNINGPAKGRPHCLICKFSLSPAVIIFAKEPAEAKEEVLNDLLKQLDETAEEFQERQFSVGVIFLSPDAQDSTNNADAEKSADIIQEAIKREQLIKRLEARAEKFKHVIVAYYLAEGPKEYKLNPKADVTLLFYERLKIIENYTYPADGLQARDVEMIMKRVRQVLPSKKKRVEEKQPKT